MPIRFTCTNPACGARVEAPDDLAGRRVRCRRCGAVQMAPPRQGPDGPSSAEGAGDIRAGDSPAKTLALACLKAGRYGLTHFRCMAALVFHIAVIYGLVWLGACVWSSVLAGSIAGLVVFASACGLLVLGFLGYFLRFLLDVAVGTLELADLPPEVPEFRPGRLAATAAMGLGLMVVYVLPVVTFPLLPLGVLALASTNDGRAFDVIWAARAAAKRPAELAALWLVLLLWGDAAVVGPVLVGLLCGSGVLPATLSTHPLALLLAIIAIGVGVILAGATACMFASVWFRCVGLFGRQNPEVLAMLPDGNRRWRALAFVGAGAAVSAVVQGTAVVALGRLLAG